MYPVIVSGVGRSGTTAIFQALQRLILSTEKSCHFVYEPYLWNLEIKDQPFEKVADRLESIESLHIEGIYCHAKTPLFLKGSHDLHDEFVRGVFSMGDGPTLAKAIRACGRLQPYLDLIPDLRIIHIIRNPLDTVNSVIDLFSFLGGDLVPGDKLRFVAEITGKFAECPTDIDFEDEVTLSRLWWRFMNEAALETAAVYPDRFFVISYDAYRSAMVPYLASLAEFCDVRWTEEPLESFDKPVGPVTSRINLGRAQIDQFAEDDDLYWNNFARRCRLVEPFDPGAAQRKLWQKYEDADGSPSSASIPRGLTALRYRGYVNEIKQEQAALKRQLADLGRQFAYLKSQLADCNQELADRNQELADRNQELADRNQELADLKTVRHQALQCQKVLRELVAAAGRSRALRLLGPAGKRIRKQIEIIAFEVEKII